MANKKIFASTAPSRSHARVPVADTVNLAGGKAYSLSDQAALAQLACTGVFNDTFYASAENQLAEVKKLADKVSPEFLAKLAVYAREHALMKDLPAYLCAVLSVRDTALFTAVFPRVIDNGKMLRNFVQMVRSGALGRKSLGSRPKKMVRAWLENATDAQLLAASVGSEPSLADVIRLSHPRAPNMARDAYFKYLLGIAVSRASLPPVVQQLENFKDGSSQETPKVPFELLAGLNNVNWTDVAKNASWTQTRMNLNTFQRHGVFDAPGMVTLLADRLKDPKQVANAKVFPYQLLAAYINAKEEVPMALRNALQNALDLSLVNVPTFNTSCAVLVDTSGSMSSAVTGHRKGSTSKVRCIDVAALFASAVMQRNHDTAVVPFDTKVHSTRGLNPLDSVMTNAQKLAGYGGGGTNCGSALEHLNQVKSKSKLVIYVSDNESWVDTDSYRRGRATSVMQAWDEYKKRVPDAKMVCIDITPNTTTQAQTRADILNVGGFSDEVFRIVDLFARGELSGDHWVSQIEAVVL